MKQDFAIIGISIKTGQVNTLDDFWKLIKENKTNFNQLSDIRMKDVKDRYGYQPEDIARGNYLERVDLFDNAFFNIAPGEAERMDPEQRLMLETAVRTVHNAGYSIKELKGSRVGIFHTFRDSQYHTFFDEESHLAAAAHLASMVGTRVANFMDWRGPVIGVDTSCSSSLAAVYYACQSIGNGDCNMALVGGVVLGLTLQSDLSSTEVFSEKGQCLPFDDRADGFVGGEGAIGLLVKKLEDAVAAKDPIYAVIKGGAVNHGGSLIQNISAPSPVSQAEVIRLAWEHSGVDPRNIAFIEAHGTGTILGDPIEFRGLTLAFESAGLKSGSICSVSSVKAQIGHLSLLAGLAGIARLVLCLKHQQLLPQHGFTKLNEQIDESRSAAYIQREMAPWEALNGSRMGGVSSFGLTGTNVHLVLEEYIRSQEPEQEHGTEGYALKIHAATPEKAKRMASSIQTYCAFHPQVNLQAFCNTIHKVLLDEKDQYGEMLLFNDRQELISRLRGLEFKTAKQSQSPKQILLLLPCIQPADHLDAYGAQSPVFLKNSEALIASVPPHTITKKGEELIKEYAALRMLIGAGFVPNKVIGAGSGKLLSMLLTDRITLQDALLNVEEMDNEKFDADGFLHFLNGISTATTIHVIGEQGKMADTLKQWMNSTKQPFVTVCFSAVNKAGSLALLAQHYHEGCRISMETFITRQGILQDLHLPIFDYQRFWPENVKPLSAGVRMATDAAAPRIHQKRDMEEIQSELHAIWSQKLKIASIDPGADFFELGGSSLLGLDVLQAIERRIGVVLEYEDMFEYSTLHTQAKLITEKLRLSTGTSVQSAVPTVPVIDEDQRAKDYAELCRKIEQSPVPSPYQPKHILLTGGTGFLGVYLLKSILEKTDAMITCMVRSENDQTAQERLVSIFHSYFPDAAIDAVRLKAVKGDITHAGLDLSEEAADAMKTVDTVYHLAASVAHFNKPEVTNDINLNGTIHLLEWAKKQAVAVFNHFSTSAIAGGWIAGVEKAHFYELDRNLGQDHGRRVYSRSKFLAEEFIEKNKEHVSVNIFRIGNIGGDSKTGLFQHNMESNNAYNRIRLLVGLGCYADEISDLTLETTPVDVVTDKVMRISLNRNHLLNTFHIFESDPLNLREIVDGLQQLDIPIKKVSNEFFARHRTRLQQESELSKENSFLGVFRYGSGAGTQFTEFLMHREATLQYLSRLGDAGRYDKRTYIQVILRYCIEKGFITVPQLQS